MRISAAVISVNKMNTSGLFAMSKLPRTLAISSSVKNVNLIDVNSASNSSVEKGKLTPPNSVRWVQLQ